MHKNDPVAVWALLIAAWGAITGTLSLGIQWWNTRYRFREPLYVSGDINTKTKTLTFTIRNRDPQIAARIEKVQQQRRRNWWSMQWYEFQPGTMEVKNEAIDLPFEIEPRTEVTFTITDEYFARAINRARSSNAEPVSFIIKAGSGYTFRLQPNINGKAQSQSVS